MNYIDHNFNYLVETLRNLSRDETFSYIRGAFSTIPEETKESLANYFHQFNYWGNLDLEKRDYEELSLRAQSLHDHIEDFVWLYDHLGDYRSKLLLYAIMNNWFQYDFETLKKVQDPMHPDYFDVDLISGGKDEVIVDLGAYVGDTIWDYLLTYGEDSYQKIYCYEITPEVFETLKQNLAKYDRIVFVQKAASDHGGTMYIQSSAVDASANVIGKEGTVAVESVTIDEDIQEPVTMIKMDIEGAEQAALRGCKRHIQEDHPTLLLSVYHNHEDIWKIPRMIEEMCPGYQFYLRYHGGNLFPTEVTLLAIYAKESTL